MVKTSAPWLTRPAFAGAAIGAFMALAVGFLSGAGLAGRLAVALAMVAAGYLCGFAVVARRRLYEAGSLIRRLRIELRGCQEHIMATGSARSLAAWMAGAAEPVRAAVGALQKEARALGSDVSAPEAVRAAAAGIAARVEALGRDLEPLRGYALPDPSRSPFDVNGLMREALDLCRHRAEERGIRFEERYAVVPPVAGSADRLQAGFLNILINAVEAMPFGGGTIAVETRHDAGRVAIRVRDTGIGIRPEHLPRVTEAFFTTKPVKGGAGLGLWETRAIVEAMDGTLAIRSTPHQGTEILLTLPEAAPLSPGRAGVPHPEEVGRNLADEGDRRIA